MTDLPLIHELTFTHTDKLLFPGEKVSKGEVINYYDAMTNLILAHCKNRPLVLQRFPTGLEGNGFYQQNAQKHFHKWINTIHVEGKERHTNEAMECHTRTGLLFLINQDVLSLHTWLSQKDTLAKPDFMVFDLDPPSESFKPVVDAAKAIQQVAKELDMQPYVMTTGSKGIHVLLPIRTELSFDTVREAAKAFAQKVCARSPNSFTTEQRKNKRKGRLFIDYLRNSYGQTTVCPYSLRALPGAPVATPLEWEELDNASLHSRSYTLVNVRQRMAQRKDPWAKILHHRCSLKERLDAL